MKTIFFIFICLFLFHSNLLAKTWVDSLDVYARTRYMPPKKMKWKWQDASLLFSFIKEYDLATEKDKSVYMDYVVKAMSKKLRRASGKSPNAVAAGMGMAFLAQHQKGYKYEKAALKVYNQYLKINRTDNKGVSHKRFFKELWDDTIFMIGSFLTRMYLWTGDEQYLKELFVQMDAHREKLLDKESGLWFHGWDGDNKNRINFCGQTGWSKNDEKRSQEIWGRGNGWVIVTLADIVNVLPKGNKYREKAATYLKEMVVNLPDIQDKTTGHWFQLPVKPEQEGNFIESSATAMFAYGIQIALDNDIILGEKYENAVRNAYIGLRKYSVVNTGDKHLTVINVCKGTCIGDMNYYLNRSSTSQKPYGLGAAILFGRTYEN
ncbi:MAG: glycoside hydrolase family 88 protein [Chitinophagales bacterium]|nr:glycoside hydrolase family 88 protein [Chitinophagales bacterium]